MKQPKYGLALSVSLEGVDTARVTLVQSFGKKFPKVTKEFIFRVTYKGIEYVSESGDTGLLGNTAYDFFGYVMRSAIRETLNVQSKQFETGPDPTIQRRNRDGKK